MAATSFLCVLTQAHRAFGEGDELQYRSDYNLPALIQHMCIDIALWCCQASFHHPRRTQCPAKQARADKWF